jgi:hypothetical protein
MAAAKSNAPLGTCYNKAMGSWLREHGFDGVSNQERYRAIQCLENLEAIDEWRATLPERKRLRLNHPNPVWHGWKASKRPDPVTEKIKQRLAAASALAASGKPVYWPQEHVRRALLAMLRARSSDLLALLADEPRHKGAHSASADLAHA